MKDKNVLSLAEKIEEAPIEECGPSDDPDKQYAYTCAFRDIAVRFISAVKRESDHELSELVSGLDTNISDDIRDAHKLKAELLPVIDALRSKFEDPEYETKAIQSSAFLDSKVLSQLKMSTNRKFDLAKLVKMCEELNDSYGRGNYISSILLLRAIINHVPPIFGQNTFAQVVANAGRSAKGILAVLQDEARPIADFHTHILIRNRESCPTKNQIEPYKASFEVLIHEVLTILHET